MGGERSRTTIDVAARGGAWCRRQSARTDAWLRELFAAATADTPGEIALVAVGGYGRAELCPQSDIDVVLVHRNHGEVEPIAERIWYPVWDRRMHLGHRVATVRQCLDLASDDLDTATALLSARLVAGSERLAHELAEGALAQWRKQAKHWLGTLAESVEARHGRSGAVAFLLEPDLKEGRGGLRDVHALQWAGAAQPVLIESDHAAIAAAYETLLRVRVELHRLTDRPSNALVLEEQAGVARALGLPGSDALMAEVSAAGSAIAWTSDDAWRRARAARRSWGRSGSRGKAVSPGISIERDEVVLTREAQASEPETTLRVARTAAEHEVAIGRDTLQQLAAAIETPTDPWPSALRDAFVDLLLVGAASIHPIESLDRLGIWERIVPEWPTVRSRPQHNAIHRFTVDRHLLETVAQAATLVSRVSRPDLLVVGALLHDIGKGYPGDHVTVGAELARTIARRMGFPTEDVDTIDAMVAHHLLLPEAATRRDLDDPATIDGVAETVGGTDRLSLLAALSEADARATAPAAWGRWKQELLALLVDRVAATIRGADSATATRFPSPEQLAMCAEPGRRVEIDKGRLTVVDTDRPGVFSRIAGVIALHGLDVHSAAAYSNGGRALSEFVVSDPVRADTPWGRVAADVEAALSGRLAITARLAERARTYGRNRPAGAKLARAAVAFHNDASEGATVIEVHAPDHVGALYRITRAMADLDLDIRLAKIETLGHQIIDSFYVVGADGAKVVDAGRLHEIERAVLHGIADGG